MQSLRFALMVACTLAMGSIAGACNALDESAPEEGGDIETLENEQSDHQSPTSKDDTQDVNGAGQCCKWKCYGSGTTWIDPHISSGCNGYASSWCHYYLNGLNDAWWGSCS